MAVRASTGVADTSKVIGSVRRITRAEFAEETAARGAYTRACDFVPDWRSRWPVESVYNRM